MKILSKAILLIGIILLLTSVLQAETPGSLPLLKMAPDARSVALGETGTAGSTGAMAAFHNPALMALSSTSQASFAYTDWLLDLTLQTGSLLFLGNRYSVGISFNAFSTPDIERRILPADEPIETFSAHDLSAGFSFAYRIKEAISLGFTGRFLHQQIYIEEANGAAFDLGVAYRLSWRDFIVGAAVKNLGEMGSLQEEKSPLPSDASIGIAGTFFSRNDISLTGAGDVQMFFEDDIRFHAGLEGSWQEHLFLRGGYQTGSELRSFAGGAGIGWNRYRFDYAYQPLAEDFQASHRFSIRINF